MNSLTLRLLRLCVKRYPEIVPHLKGQARWAAYATGGEYKTYDYYLQQLERLIRSVYQGNIASEFLDIMANLISGQLKQAYDQAWADEGTEDPFPEYLSQSYEQAVMGQYQHVDGLYRDIVSARELQQPLDPILARAPLWAQRWTESYNEAVRLIQLESGGKLVWRLGATEEHCSSCSRLDGVVAYAYEWDELGVSPQGAPNDKLECGGWRCDCSLQPTDQRRSPKAFDSIAHIVMSR